MAESGLLALRIIGILFQTISLILHGFGVYLIKSLLVNLDNKIQYIYILFLSLTEILTTIGMLMITTCDLMTNLYGYNLDSLKTKTIIILFTFNSILLYGNTIAIVIDKALSVWLNIKYALYLTETRAKYFEFVLIFVSIILCISVLVAQHIVNFDYSIPHAVYIRPILDMPFILCGILCYGYIFNRFLLSRRSPPSSSSILEQESLCNVFWKSRFLLSVCLAVTYIAFLIVPDFLTVYLLRRGLRTRKWMAVRIMLYSIAFVIDALIYIFLDQNIMQLLRKKLNVFHMRRCIRGTVRTRSSSIQIEDIQLEVV